MSSATIRRFRSAAHASARCLRRDANFGRTGRRAGFRSIRCEKSRTGRSLRAGYSPPSPDGHRIKRPMPSRRRWSPRSPRLMRQRCSTSRNSVPASCFFDSKKWKKLPFEARARVRIAATVAPSKPSRSNTARPAASKSSRARATMIASGIEVWIITLEYCSRDGQAGPSVRDSSLPIPVFAKTYWEIGGAGGPAGAAGAGGGTEAVTAGDGPDNALGVEAPVAGSGVPLETAAGVVEEPCGAGVTGGTGSARSAVVSPLPAGFGASNRAASDLLSPGSLSPSYLAVSLWGLSSLAGSLFAGSSLAESVLAASVFAASVLAASVLAASVLAASVLAASVLAASVLAASILGRSSLPG